MTWLVVCGVALVAFELGFIARRGRSRSPVETYEEQQGRATIATDLAEEAGTMAEVRMLVAQGNKTAAIKALRGQTNCGLREAKGAVEALERETRTAAG